jgi:hypothetical protein
MTNIKALDRIFSNFFLATPGCALAVMKDGKLVNSTGYGMA